MADDSEIIQQVRRFYDQVGWQSVSEGMYQNARYEDLRPVSHEYIHRCHLRVGRFLQPTGRYLLDAGSGPIQYPEYLTYSQGYTYRVCADISFVALVEARRRLGARGLYVVADAASLPFRPDVFEGAVSLHTFHHLPEQNQWQAYVEIYRTLTPGCSAAVVNGWTTSPLMRRLDGLIRLMERVTGRIGRLFARRRNQPKESNAWTAGSPADPTAPQGTFVIKIDASRLKQHLQGQMPFEIRVWRSVSTHFLRAVIHPCLAGRLWLRLLYALEEKNPAYFGEQGQYPLVIIKKLRVPQEGI
jgi:SAM-dependent methyltransferase